MNTPQLADYLINNDFEIQVANRDYAAIFEGMIDNEPSDEAISLEQLKEAVEIALEDPYMQTFIVPKFAKASR